MTNHQSQAETLGILLWIYAGVQSLFALIIALVILLYGIGGVLAIVQGGSDAAPGAVIMIVFVLIYVVLLGVGITSIILNIKAGNRLKQPTPAPKNLLIASAVGNFLSFLCGGMCLAPFGIALGVYGLWFTLSDTGTAYFNHGIETPPPIGEYDIRN